MPGIQAVVFDLYGTLIDIRTNEGKNELWENLSLFMSYYGIEISADICRGEYKLGIESGLRESNERFPEVDLEKIFGEILNRRGQFPASLAVACCKLFRLLSRERFGLFPETLPVLRAIKSSGCLLAAVSNGQKVFSLDEMKMVQIKHFFECIFFSSEYGFQKPDSRLFTMACSGLRVDPGASVYIGDNPETDIAGAKQIGMKMILLNRRSEALDPGLGYDVQVSDLGEAWKWINKIPLE